MDTMMRKLRRLSPARRLRFVLFLYWLHICETVSGVGRRRGFHFVNERRHSAHPMYPTPHMMVTITFGMAGVSIIAMILSVSVLPLSLYLIPMYLVYVAGLLGIKASRLRTTRTGR